MTHQGNYIASRHFENRTDLSGHFWPLTFRHRAFRMGFFNLALCIVLIALAIIPTPVTATNYPDLNITWVQINTGGAPAGYGFTFSVNPVSVTVKNIGAAASAATTLKLVSSDGFSGTGAVPALVSGASTVVTINDTTIRTTDGVNVSYTATVDPDNLIVESDETNNVYTKSNIPFSFNGYKGKALYKQGGSNVTTKKTFDLFGGIVHSFGDSYYRSGSFSNGWTSYNVTWKYNATNATNSAPAYFELVVPANATVMAARLYIPYTWDLPNDTEKRGYSMPNNVTVYFNSYNISSAYDGWYWDRGNFGEWGPYTYGLVTYDVTSYYQKNATNTLNFNRLGNVDKLSLYGMTLLVVYQNPAETRKQVFLNEEFDLLGADPTNYKTTEAEAIAYVPFTGLTIDPSKVKRANLTTFVPSGDSNEGNLLLGNGTVIASNVWNYGASGQPVGENGFPQVAVDIRDVTSYLKSSGNVFGIQSTAWASQPCMAASQQFLVVEYYKAPVAGFAAGTISGAAPLQVTFTDQSTNTPTSWAWTFGDGNTSTAQNTVHTYSYAGTFTVSLTATNPGGSGTVTKSGYITVKPGSGLVALPGYSLPTDPNHDGLYEDLTGNGAVDFKDVQLYFQNMDWISQNEPVALFDYSGNNAIDFKDVQLLFKEI